MTHRSSVAEDRAGIDYLAHRSGGRRPLAIDLKEISYVPGPDETPDVLLETACRGQVDAPGWATDETKRTDLFLLVYGDGSSVVLAARQVREALQRYGRAWTTQYRTGSSATRGYYETFYSDYSVYSPQRATVILRRPPSHDAWDAEIDTADYEVHMETCSLVEEWIGNRRATGDRFR